VAGEAVVVGWVAVGEAAAEEGVAEDAVAGKAAREVVSGSARAAWAARAARPVAWAAPGVMVARSVVGAGRMRGVRERRGCGGMWVTGPHVARRRRRWQSSAVRWRRRCGRRATRAAPGSVQGRAEPGSG